MEDYYSDTEDNSKVKNFLSNMSVFTRWYSYETGINDRSGSVYWCVSEFINNCLVYKFADGDHGHCFDDVLCKIIDNKEYDDIEGDRNQYSNQELVIIDTLKARLKEVLSDGNSG